MSRETRLLLTTGAAAIAVLWILARVRFDDPAVTSNPVAPVLNQLSGAAQYDALAAEIADVQTRVLPWLVAVDLAPAHARAPRAAGFRWKDDLALVVLPVDAGAIPGGHAGVRAADPASGLAVIRVSGQAPSSPPAAWTPRRSGQPRYFAMSDVSTAGVDGEGEVTLRPVFVGALMPWEGSVWPGTIWAVPSDSALTPGSFVFTTGGDFVGVVGRQAERLAIVPAQTVLAEADRLQRTIPATAGTLRLEVQPLSAPLASLTGAASGVVVTWVDAHGPASGLLMVGDVIEAVNGRNVASRGEFDAHVARLAAGDTASFRVRRHGQLRELSIQAAAVESAPAGRELGLTVRGRAGIGAEVAGVDPASAASEAGLLAGDVITVFGEAQAPTPRQIARSFAALHPGERVMVAVSRGTAHHVLVLGR